MCVIRLLTSHYCLLLSGGRQHIILSIASIHNQHYPWIKLIIWKNHFDINGKSSRKLTVCLQGLSHTIGWLQDELLAQIHSIILNYLFQPCNSCRAWCLIIKCDRKVNSRWSQLGPSFPGGQEHVPDTGSQRSAWVHWHSDRQFTPYVPGWQAVSTRAIYD